MPVPLALIGLGLAAGAGAGILAKGASAIAGSLGPANKAERKLLKADLKKMENGELGLSEGQRRRFIGDRMRGIHGATKGDTDALRRVEGATDFASSGKVQTARDRLAAVKAEMGVKAVGEVDQLDTNLVASREASIKQRLAAKAAAGRATAAGIGDAAVAGASTGAQIGLGVADHQLKRDIASAESLFA